MTRMVKITILCLWFFFIGCNLEYPEENSQSLYTRNSPPSSTSTPKKKNYVGEFEYQLQNCEGSQSVALNQYELKGNLTIQIDRNRVQLLRQNKASHLNVFVRSTWSSETQKLTRSHGQMGIADTEDWRSSVGSMRMSQHEVSGQITNVDIIQGDNFCGVMFRFRGVAIDMG